MESSRTRPHGSGRRAFLVAAVAGFVFGAADQYIGSLKPMVALGPWTISLSQMSALWLLLPFVFGARQESARGAVLVGSIATFAGLVGYFAMTVGPLEIPLREAPAALPGLLASNVRVIVGGVVTGPLFGYLGWRWRTERSWLWALPVAAAFLLEPLARVVSQRLLGPSWIWWAEAALGACLLAAFVRGSAGRRRAAA
ncbi:MAG TPA: hypothetical protein VNN79_00900 [Actinomycetota bacterium]|nr:hypothetical protein [Actinomycetota bacterium]